jgi:membrane protein insertase Oxa1/YidC/SpoIIIJ
MHYINCLFCAYTLGAQERIQLETARLYKQAGVNPLAGCLPTLATLPVWIGLYRALSNVANDVSPEAQIYSCLA